MNGYLLDTNVVSEMTKHNPNPTVAAFLSQREDCWISSLLMHELEFGVRLMPLGRRRDRLRMRLSQLLADYEDRILSLDPDSALWAAQFRAQAVRSGRPPHIIDMLMAGIARSKDLTVVTRNTSDFEHLDVDVVNPWKEE